LDHRGILQTCVLGALATYNWDDQGHDWRQRKCTQSLPGLPALWKDTDPDIPIMKEAKAEYAKLQ
jgi:hypothetical protein